MVIKIVYHFVGSNLGVGISSKKGVNRTRRGEGGVLEVVLPEREQMTDLGEGFAWGTRGRGKLYKLTIK